MEFSPGLEKLYTWACESYTRTSENFPGLVSVTARLEKVIPGQVKVTPRLV